MRDSECVHFLQWALPQLRLRWRGFRRVRRQVCKRIARRLGELGLPDLDTYREHLASHPSEWKHLDSFCRITISRFYRDAAVFDCLRDTVLPQLSVQAVERGRGELRCWSVGCGSGEEPYTLLLLGRFALASPSPALQLSVLATDADPRLITRAQAGLCAASSVRELPPAWRATAFTSRAGQLQIRPALREAVEFVAGDVRGELPAGPFDLILCRNVVFTYFEESLQREILERFTHRLFAGAALVVGAGEALPDHDCELAPWVSPLGIYRRYVQERGCLV